MKQYLNLGLEVYYNVLSTITQYVNQGSIKKVNHNMKDVGTSMVEDQEQETKNKQEVEEVEQSSSQVTRQLTRTESMDIPRSANYLDVSREILGITPPDSLLFSSSREECDSEGASPRSGDSPKPEIFGSWVNYKDIDLYSPLFDKGIILSRPHAFGYEPKQIDVDSDIEFELGPNNAKPRQLRIRKVDDTTVKVKTAKTLLKQLNNYEIKPELLPVGLTFEYMPKDGHCLYNAVAIYLETNVFNLRNLVADAIEHNIEAYRDFITLAPGRTIADYITDIRYTNMWAGDLEIATLMQALNRPIITIGSNGRVINPLVLNDYTSLLVNAIYVYYDNHNHYSGLSLQHGYCSWDIINNLRNLNLYSPEISSGYIIANTARREEVFMPLVVQQHSAKELGFYAYPWLSDNAKQCDFKGFERYVTAGCMFGSTLKGIDKFDQKFNLIKHDIKFHPGQQIERIVFNSKEANAYETVVLKEFQKSLALINRLAKKREPNGNKVQLYYHLPYYDYMLFGIELFLRGRMTYRALQQFLTILLEKKAQLITRVFNMCQHYKDIELIVASPFDNLFGAANNGKDILSMLGIYETDPATELTDEQRLQAEHKLVQSCLFRLMGNTFNLNHQQVWCDFVRDNVDEINNLEQLFQSANAVMLGIASYRTDNYSTCSLLPVSEKQIQVQYASICKKLQLDLRVHNYPAIFNITTMDPVIGHDDSSRGLLFYFSSCQDSLRELVTDARILTAAHQNVARTAQNRDNISLEQILDSFSKLSLK